MAATESVPYDYQAGADEDARALVRVFSCYIVSAMAWLLFATAVGLLDPRALANEPPMMACRIG